jgi:hypothetical protein
MKTEVIVVKLKQSGFRAARDGFSILDIGIAVFPKGNPSIE